MERLKIEFPSFPKKYLDSLDNFVINKEYAKKKRNALIRDMQREKIALKLITDEQIYKQIEIRLENTKNEISKLETVIIKLLFLLIRYFLIIKINTKF